MDSTETRGTSALGRDISSINIILTKLRPLQFELLYLQFGVKQSRSMLLTIETHFEYTD